MKMGGFSKLFKISVISEQVFLHCDKNGYILMSYLIRKVWKMAENHEELVSPTIGE